MSRKSTIRLALFLFLFLTNLWIRFHLANAEAGGPGTGKNLVPTSQKTNQHPDWKTIEAAEQADAPDHQRLLAAAQKTSARVGAVVADGRRDLVDGHEVGLRLLDEAHALLARNRRERPVLDRGRPFAKAGQHRLRVFDRGSSGAMSEAAYTSAASARSRAARDGFRLMSAA